MANKWKADFLKLEAENKRLEQLVKDLALDLARVTPIKGDARGPKVMTTLMPFDAFVIDALLTLGNMNTDQVWAVYRDGEYAVCAPGQNSISPTMSKLRQNRLIEWVRAEPEEGEILGKRIMMKSVAGCPSGINSVTEKGKMFLRHYAAEQLQD